MAGVSIHDQPPAVLGPAGDPDSPVDRISTVYAAPPNRAKASIPAVSTEACRTPASLRLKDLILLQETSRLGSAESGRFVMLDGGFDDAGCKEAVMMVRRKSGAAMSKDRSLLQRTGRTERTHRHVKERLRNSDGAGVAMALYAGLVLRHGGEGW